ncbi:hypothetical protein [Flavobacterium sp.]|uniref:hypothetical protein n=1 Tax=Flavobacterium sp. TaxID=239 RepID=UPI00262337CA|nr:hypothetical protein [Flavobacterium sp.]
MKKSILKLKGVQELTKNEQKEVNGGAIPLCQRPDACAYPQCWKYFTVEACFGTPIERP